MFRQGDVAIHKVEGCRLKTEELKEIPRDNGRVILAYGEVTGHAHAISADNVVMWQADDGTIFIDVKETENTSSVLLEHEEHDTITIPAGIYTVTRQREYAPDATRFVAD